MTGLFGFNWGLPEGITDLGVKIDSMMSVIHWFMLILFIGWGGFMAYCLFRFRARPNHKASYEPIHASWSKWMEIGIAIGWWPIAVPIGRNDGQKRTRKHGSRQPFSIWWHRKSPCCALLWINRQTRSRPVGRCHCHLPSPLEKPAVPLC